MRRSIFLLFIIGIVQNLFAQSGNEWINFGQPYFKIPVAKDGIYRLTYSDLQSAGFPIGENPKRLQLFHRGIEQSITVIGESDELLDPGDYIEFYGRKNDGTLDANLYRPSSLQPHSYYNLFNDTTSYFLTVGPFDGKRMQLSSEPNPGLTTEAYHHDVKLLVNTTQYSRGLETASELQNTFFDRGEGWTGNEFRNGQFVDYSFTGITGTVPANGTPQLEVLLVGRGAVSHQFEIYAGPSSAALRLVTTESFTGFDAFKTNVNIEWTDISVDGNLTVRIRALGVGGGLDRLSASYLKIEYPQRLDANGASKIFQLAENAGGKSYIEIENPAAGMLLYDITDYSNVSTVGTTSSTTLNAVINETSISRKIYATNEFVTPSIKKVVFREIIPAQHNFIIISNKQLMKSALGYDDPVKAYGAYRASPEGGMYDTLVVDIGQLFNQFSYGETTPLAIYNFMKFMVENGSPKYLFIIGKGLDVWYRYYRSPSSYPVYKDFVPSAGMPASDMFFTVGLNGTTHEPALPTGRIPATSPVHVAAYLNKIKEKESQPFDELWKKDLLHLSGGIEEGEPQLFKSFMEGFESVAEDYYLGGNVKAIAKQTTNPVELINVSEQVNKGLSLITFFGHSSSSTIDFDIGFVTNPVMGYDNKGKYPMFLINGCNAGSFFLNGIVFGEDWINASDKGAAGFIAHTWFGLLGTLKFYSDTFYEVAYGDSVYIHQGIGDIQKEVARRYMLNSQPSIANITQVQQMVLLGDPAVKLFGAHQPDYEINDNNVFLESFNGEPVTALTDSFAINVIVRNFGRAKEDTMRIEVTRTLNDNSTIVYDSLFQPVLYSDTLTLIIRRGRENGFGNNSFHIRIDADNIIEELSEENNEATLGYFIPLNATKNLYPYNYAIVNATETSLSFQSTNLFSDEREFLLELDTVNTFDSPFLKQFSVTGKVLGRQTVTLLTQDSAAYYWRTKLADPLPGESDNWVQSSFTYIDNGQEGWAQVHFPQYLTNPTEGLVMDESLRQFGFQSTITNVDIVTYGDNHPAKNTDVSVKIDNAEYNLTAQGFICRDHTLNLIAFDRRSTVPYIGVPFKWYNRAGRACGREPWVINSFAASEFVTGNSDDLIQYVDNITPGDSVVIFNIGYLDYSNWPVAAKNKLGELGISVSQIDALQTAAPVVIFGRKGLAPGAAKVFTATGGSPDAEELVVNETITGRYTSGDMTTALIGPAQSWQSFVLGEDEVEQEDIFEVDIFGVKLDGTQELLRDGLTTDLDLTEISAEEYPYLQLKFYAEDDVNLTPAQLKKWLVLYEPVPDGLLVYSGGSDRLSIPEGSVFSATYGFTNITDKLFSDSLIVRYEMFNKTTRIPDLKTLKVHPPAPGDTTFFNISFTTTGKQGLNDLDVFVNPRIQAEQYYDNNVLELKDYLDVIADEFRPVLDVMIDGRHVENNDFVSPNPKIEIMLWDENPYILKKDTLGINIFLSYPCDLEECEFQPVYFSRNDITWYAATDTSHFRVDFNPDQLPEGQYTLMVTAQDAKGNGSSPESFQISFQVKYELTVTLLQPYPNPSDDKVFFRVVSTGEQPLDLFQIKILDLNGKEVQNFTQTTNFHVGTNEWTWSGTDAGGTHLPGGLYVYKLFLKAGNKELARNGKIVFIR